MLKILAILTMLIDHIGFVFFPDDISYRLIGRVAFPLFAWGVAMGYHRTSNLLRYAKRILVLALVSQPIYYLVFDNNSLNICFSLFLGLMAIFFYKQLVDKKNNYAILYLVLIFLAAHFLNVEYGIYGILMILIFGIFKHSWSFIGWQSLLLLSTLIIAPLAYIAQIFSLPIIFLIPQLKKYDFPINRTLQYSFYPVHLALIYLISIII